MVLQKDPAQRFQTPNELLKAMPTITGAIDAGRRITRQSLQKTPATDSRVGTRKTPGRLAPKKISVARLPVTGSDVFGREEDIAFLDAAWANQNVNVVTIVAWAGVGKSTLVNHWLRRMAAEHYHSAERVFGWSFYRQGSSGGTSSADEFLDATLSWFGDSDPRLGTAWEKGERLAKLVAHRRTLLVLDGLEPLQNPPGPQEGRLREPSLQAFLRELAAFNTGLCLITTRTPVADLADHERSLALRRELERLSSAAGAKLLCALGVKGHEAELRTASDQVDGHCLALALLGSFLTDAYDGDIRYHAEVSGRLGRDVRQGVHARKVMESYKTWFGEGPELSVLRMLGLFDRPVDEKTFGLQIWRSGGVHFPVEDWIAPPIHCLSNQALSEWHLGEVASCQATMAEAISLAKQLHDTQASVYLLYWSGFLAYFEGNLAETERLASDLIEMSTRQNIATWLPHGKVLRGWARSASGDTAEGIATIEDGIGDYRAAGAILATPFFLALKAEAFHLANRTCEALEAINEAEALVERSGARLCVELHWLRGVFLTALGADETKIEASFCEAIRIAKEQKSVSVEKRAEATYAEYRRQKANASGGRGFRLPLC